MNYVSVPKSLNQCVLIFVKRLNLFSTIHTYSIFFYIICPIANFLCEKHKAHTARYLN